MPSPVCLVSGLRMLIRDAREPHVGAALPASLRPEIKWDSSGPTPLTQKAGWRVLPAGPETCQGPRPWERQSWAFLMDAFNNYCLSNRRQSEIVSKAKQSGMHLEVGSEICLPSLLYGCYLNTFFI